jgi:hypothetical protein
MQTWTWLLVGLIAGAALGTFGCCVVYFNPRSEAGNYVPLGGYACCGGVFWGIAGAAASLVWPPPKDEPAEKKDQE